LEIVSFDLLPSTQKFLIEAIENRDIAEPTAVITKEQTDGVGSRDNSWEGGEGNFFASFALTVDMLPDDLPMSSASIYFAFLMKIALEDTKHGVWLKWPNDIDNNNDKIGGVITKLKEKFLIVGIGINLKKIENGYSSLDTDISPLILLNIFIDELKKKPKWKQVFSQYKIEFVKSKLYFTHVNEKKIDMKNAFLCSDGSLLVEGKKVYSLR